MTDWRCHECGSWGVKCASSKPVPGCGCARCLSASLVRARALLRRALPSVRADYDCAKALGHENLVGDLPGIIQDFLDKKGAESG